MRKLLSLSFLVLVACGDSSGTVGDPVVDPGPSAPSEPSEPSDPSSPSDSSGPSPSSAAPSDPQFIIAMRGSTTPVVQAGSFAGETPRNETVAIKSLWLYRSATDPSPVKVFDRGDDALDVELVSGKPVELAKIAAKSLPAGVFTVAKAGATYVRYQVDARMHESAGVIDGYFERVQALSDGAVIAGAKKKRGDFRESFVAKADGETLGTVEGKKAPAPPLTPSGGIVIDTSGPEAFYMFKIQLTVDPNISQDHVVELEANVHGSFRWIDRPFTGYTNGLLDMTPLETEPVVAIGPNAFTVTLSAK